MGLFRRKSKDPEPVKVETEVEEALEVKFIEYDETWVTVTAKNLKTTAFDGDRAYFSGGYIWEDEKLIKVRVGDEVLFEMTPRSKDFKTLQEIARRKAHDVTIYRREGEYGTYYRARVRFKLGERTELI